MFSALHRRVQYLAYDILTGRIDPTLGRTTNET